MDGGFNGDTVCRRRPYNRVTLGVWFTILYMIYRCKREYGIKVSPCMGNPVCILYMLYRCERAYGIDIQSKHLKVLNSFFSVKIVFTV